MPENSVCRCRRLMFLVVAVLALGLDLASKEWTFRQMGVAEQVWLIDGILSLQTTLNEGALFGIGAGWGLLFVSLSFVALAGIGYWVWRGNAANDGVLCLALAMVTGGILGNLYDRLGFPGMTWAPLRNVYAVRDFILLQYDDWKWPNFNLADSFLVLGVGLLIFHAYVLEPRQKKAQQASASEPPAQPAAGG